VTFTLLYLSAKLTSAPSSVARPALWDLEAITAGGRSILYEDLVVWNVAGRILFRRNTCDYGSTEKNGTYQSG
jgi:hypothetical protein